MIGDSFPDLVASVVQSMVHRDDFFNVHDVGGKIK
jgi:hypothetical protein